MDKRDTILIVDDMEINRAILRGLFERDYNLLEAENGEQALMLLEQCHEKIACMLLDVVMPVKDGYQVLTEMGERGRLAEVPVVVITAEGSAENEVRAFDLGASDIVMKPFEPYVVKRRVQNIVELNRHQLHLEELVDEQADKLRQSNEVMIDALSSVIEYRSLESGQHILRIRMFTKILLEDVERSYREYNLDERNIAIIASAAAMHDIGKIAIPDAILNKPGPLTKEEFEVMKTHSAKGCEILASLDGMGDEEYLRYAYNICRYHHERWDGRGYPDGLKGDNIPVCAQVVGIADAYDALTTDRVYKKAFPHEQAFNMILNGECGAFSPRLLECFKNVRAQFAELSRAYADGRSPKADRFGAQAAPKLRYATQDTLQQGQTKYFSLLRYLNCAVMEVDLNTGIYHLVYVPSTDFELLRTGGSFEEAICNFAQGSVHPDDRAQVVEGLDGYVRTFFEDGLMKRDRRYRVYSHADGGYRWCEATMLRLDTGDPKQRRAFIVWRPMEPDEAAGRRREEERASRELLDSVMGGILLCRNDQWFTLKQISESFTRLTGYDQAQLERRFQGRYLNLIYPADREETLEQTREQLRAGNAIEVEYRLACADGRTIWVLEKSRLMTDGDGEEYFYCALVDVTQSKSAQEELRLTLERHKIIMDQTNDIIFEWDIARDTLIYSSNWETKFGYTPIRDNVRRKMLTVSHIYPEDLADFARIMDEMSTGTPYAEAEFRVAKSDGRYIWCRIRASAQFDEAGRPIKAVGVIVDVDDDRRTAQALRDKAERDGLTKLYNKPAARRQVEAYLEERSGRERAALLIIDVDNFKQVNDRYGHMFGDAVLTEIAGEIRKLFRGGDIISRIGGDEFLVFLRRIPDTGLAADRAAQLIAAFQSLFREHLADCRLSCSIGVSFCPEDGTSFQELFQRADRALYRAKNQGKDRYVLYDRQAMDLAPGAGEGAQSAASTRIDSDDSRAGVATDLIRQTFRQLYEANDLDGAVHSILELVGLQFNLSRAYIFECPPEEDFCRDTFEWHAAGVPAGVGTVHPVRDEGLGGYYPDHFNEAGIFYCPNVDGLPGPQRDVLRRQGIKSMLQCAMREGGAFRGYVGFDDCNMRRLWTQEQIDAITFVSELLSVFLLKKRAQERSDRAAEDMRLVLDNQDAWIYVVDPDTMQLLFVNAKTHELTPHADVGMRCHREFLNRDGVCPGCPVRDIRAVGRRSTEFYNDVLDIWSAVDAALIHWGGREACLVSCHDITPYKKLEANTKTEQEEVK